MKNIELVKMAFENIGATCEIEDNKLEVEVNLIAYKGNDYTFGAELTIDEDIPAINFLSTWSRDGFAMDFSYYDSLECQTESEEEFREVGAEFNCWMEKFFDEYIKLAEEYTIEGKYTEDMMKNLEREIVYFYNMESNSLKIMNDKELGQYLKNVSDDINSYRNVNGDEFVIACNEIMNNSITIGDIAHGLVEKGIQQDVIKLACRYFIASTVVEELNKIMEGE